jgi:GAF domain
MDSSNRLRRDLGAVMQGPGMAIDSADRLCQACVELLEVDGAAISVVLDGVTEGTFGSSNELSRRIDELQYTFGEGPCLDAVRLGQPILVDDLGRTADHRWPAFSAGALNSRVGAVFALPVKLATSTLGALDLFRTSIGPLSKLSLSGAQWAAELAALPLLDLASEDADNESKHPGNSGWDQLSSWGRIEIYQATGMVMAQLDVGSAEALVRIRAYAFAHDRTASEVAWDITERRMRFDPEDWGQPPRAVGSWT